MKFKLGDKVKHNLTNTEMIVIATSSEGLIDCRYVDSNGVFIRQYFFPQELHLINNDIKQAGFEK